MHPLERNLSETLRRHGLAPRGTAGLVCVSGGADSTALLLLLHAVAGRLGLRLEVLHGDHGLRPESGAEARGVAALAARLGLPFHLRATTRLRRRTAGVPAAAREWRRAVAGRLARQRGLDWIATGHQRDDELESILLKLLRGCHLAHIRGMGWRAGRFIRPLLEVPHEALAAYLRGRGEAWAEDPSNRDPRYLRNRVRHELLPLLEELSGGGIARRLEALAGQSAALEALLETFPAPARSAPGAAAHWMEMAALRALPPLAAGAALHDFIQERLPGEVEHGQVEQALALVQSGKAAWRLDLPGGRLLKGRGGRLLLERRGAAGKAVLHRVEGWRIAAPPGLPVKLRGGRPPTRPAADALTVYNLPPRARLELRPRHEGDRFHPPWKQRPVKVKDFLRDQHVPLWERDTLPCLVWEGRVIAIYPKFVGRGHDRPAEDAAPGCLRLLPG